LAVTVRGVGGDAVRGGHFLPEETTAALREFFKE
jgi:hypothetical protein